MKILFTTKAAFDIAQARLRTRRVLGQGGFQTRPYETFVLFVSFVVRMNLRFLYAFSPRRQTTTSTSAAPPFLMSENPPRVTANEHLLLSGKCALVKPWEPRFFMRTCRIAWAPAEQIRGANIYYSPPSFKTHGEVAMVFRRINRFGLAVGGLYVILFGTDAGKVPPSC
jgi:hypothetical protein